MGRIGLVVNHAIVWLLLVQLHKCSEFPERECCDPIYPSIPELELLPPSQQTTTIASSSSSYAAGTGVIGNTGRSGECTEIFLHQRQSIASSVPFAVEKKKVLFNLISHEIANRISPVKLLILNFHFQSESKNFSVLVFSAPALMDINSILKLFSTFAGRWSVERVNGGQRRESFLTLVNYTINVCLIRVSSLSLSLSFHPRLKFSTYNSQKESDANKKI